MSEVVNRVARGSISFEFKEVCEEVTKSYRLELDSQRNADSFFFKLGSKAYVRVYPSGTNPNYDVTIGEVVPVEENVEDTVEETLTFARSDSTTLRYDCDEVVECNWVGKSPGTPIITKRDIRFSRKVTGVLKIKYKTHYDLIYATCDTKGLMLLEAYDTKDKFEENNRYGYLTINWGIESKLNAYNLTLDDERNKYKTKFTPNSDQAYVRMVPHSDGAHLRVNIGHAEFVERELEDTTEDEYVIFTRTNSARLRSICDGVISYSWLGTDCGSPTFINDEVYLPNRCSGVLKVSYKTKYDLIKTTCNTTTLMLLEAYDVKDGKEDFEGKYGYLTINWGIEERKPSEAYTLELDPEKNEGRSHFNPGDVAYVRLFPTGHHPHLRTNVGSASLIGGHSPLDIKDEYIILTRSDSSSLRYPYEANLHWEWVGRNTCNGNPVFEKGETRVTLPRRCSGVIKVSYTSYFDLIRVYCDQETKVLLEAYDVKDGKEDFEGRYGSIVLDWTHEAREVVLTVRSACGRFVLPGVKVYVDGKFVGVTGRDGRINLGKLRVGRHSLKTVKEGFKNSDEDMISNDFFDVPSSQEG